MAPSTQTAAVQTPAVPDMGAPPIGVQASGVQAMLAAPRAHPAPGALRARAEEAQRRSFLRMVSHELRTPLNAIIGFSEIISSELYGPVSEPRYRDHALIVHESGLRLLKLINDVLDVARLEAGTMDLDLRPEQAPAALEEAVRAGAEAAEAAGVRVETRLSADLPPVLADSRGLRTVFTTLIGNAVAHSPKGGTVEVTARAQGRTVCVEVRDHGEGVSPQDLARILRPFADGESALVRRTEGAGLDLALVGLLCRAMHGALVLRSDPSGGLRALVRLPAAAKPRMV